MSIADNVGFGCRMRKVAAPARKRKVTDAWDVGWTAWPSATRTVRRQQQRAALARRWSWTDLLLLDEPFSNWTRSFGSARERWSGYSAGSAHHPGHPRPGGSLAVSDRIAVLVVWQDRPARHARDGVTCARPPLCRPVHIAR